MICFILTAFSFCITSWASQPSCQLNAIATLPGTSALFASRGRQYIYAVGSAVIVGSVDGSQQVVASPNEAKVVAVAYGELPYIIADEKVYVYEHGKFIPQPLPPHFTKTFGPAKGLVSVFHPHFGPVYVTMSPRAIAINQRHATFFPDNSAWRSIYRKGHSSVLLTSGTSGSLPASSVVIEWQVDSGQMHQYAVKHSGKIVHTGREVVIVDEDVEGISVSKVDPMSFKVRASGNLNQRFVEFASSQNMSFLLAKNGVLYGSTGTAMDGDFYPIAMEKTKDEANVRQPITGLTAFMEDDTIMISSVHQNKSNSILLSKGFCATA